MKATIPYIEQKFEEFNQQMFAGQLPKLPIELSDAKTFLGVCAFKTIHSICNSLCTSMFWFKR